MHPIAIIILIALLMDLTLAITADLLNLQRARTRLPAQFKGWYDAERYAQSQRYLRVNTRFGWLVSAVNLCAVLGFWFGDLR